MSSVLRPAGRREAIAALAAPWLGWMAGCSRTGAPGPAFDASFLVPGEAAPRSLSSFRGRVVVVTVWAAGCAHCDQQAGALERLSARYSAEGLLCLVLHERAQDFSMGGLSILRGAMEPSQTAALAAARPLTIVLDREGRLRSQHEELRDEQALEVEIRALLGT